MERKLTARLVETFRHYATLGFISFGGPGVHVVILRRRFVDELKWLDAITFQDLFSLGNALPGPGSTQLAFSIAIARNGTLAGFLAFFLWALPGALAMAGLGFGVKSIPDVLPPTVYGLLTGLNAAAVGLIAVAAYQLSVNAVTDSMTRLIVFGSASFGICYHAAWMYPVLIVVGGILTLSWDYRTVLTTSLRQRVRRRPRRSPSANEPIELQRRQQPSESDPGKDLEVTTDDIVATQILPEVAETTHISSAASTAGLRQRNNASSGAEASAAATTPTRDESLVIMTPRPLAALAAGVLCAVSIITIVVTRSQLDNPPRALDFFANMLLAGVIIFGGGPVVIPLLRGYTVENGWVSSRDFLLGYAILNAMPGPNFNFSVFLGILSLPSNPVLGAFLGFFGIFSPGIGIKLALLPLYKKWRRSGVAKSVLRGLNAAAAGLVYTAVYALFLVGYIYMPADGSANRTSASGPLTSDPWWAVCVGGAFVAGQHFQMPAVYVIAGGALAGLAWYGVQQG